MFYPTLVLQENEFEIASSKNVRQFKYLGMTPAYQNFIHEEITGRLHSGSACYFSMQTLYSSQLLMKNRKLTTYKMVILPVVYYGSETWYIIFWEERG